ncbi:DUF4405 domain-containing protein [Derxia lacustris]|uniref:DUF4405 domain-containing protein n=1 Tax=Derxia lacustris TaxID=764842 RepID=UPI000A178522|nr:DUF4405 domain-containing protein [Derxia lacustris]
MNKLTREWATSLTIGAFALMAATGLLMFFHLDRGLQKSVHEWGGWFMVAAVAGHGFVNWASLKRYFQLPGKGPALIGACVTLLLASFIVLPGGASEASPPALAMQAIARAPIATVAPLFGKTAEQARSQLAQAGVTLVGDDATLASVVGKDREKLGEALRALARP